MNEQEVLHQALDEIILSRKALQASLKELESKYPDQLYVYDSCTNFVLVRMPRAKEVFEGSWRGESLCDLWAIRSELQRVARKKMHNC